MPVPLSSGDEAYLALKSTDPKQIALQAAALGKSLGSKPEVDACFQRVAKAVSATFDEKIVQEGCVAPLKQAVLAAIPLAKFP